jgi:hypothetical protein
MDLALLKTLKTKPDAQTCTVRVSTKSELPATRDKLLDTVTKLLADLKKKLMRYIRQYNRSPRSGNMRIHRATSVQNRLLHATRSLTR